MLRCKETIFANNSAFALFSGSLDHHIQTTNCTLVKKYIPTRQNSYYSFGHAGVIGVTGRELP